MAFGKSKTVGLDWFLNAFDRVRLGAFSLRRSVDQGNSGRDRSFEQTGTPCQQKKGKIQKNEENNYQDDNSLFHPSILAKKGKRVKKTVGKQTA